jgi:hypothetical protein
VVDVLLKREKMIKWNEDAGWKDRTNKRHGLSCVNNVA